MGSNDTSHEVRVTIDRDLDGHRVDVVLSYPLRAHDEQLLDDLRAQGNLRGLIECRMHDDDPLLRDYQSSDGRVHGIWLELAQWPRQPGRLLLRHWRGSQVTGTHAVPSRMTPEHRHRQDYIAARGQSFGYSVELEKTLPNGFRPDVVVAGATATMAAEVQMVAISRRSLTRRAQGARAAGLESVWFPGKKAGSHAFTVPHVETNERFGMNPRQWTVVTGPRTLVRERCTPSSRVPCPKRRPGWCGGWHPLWEPMRGLVVDDIVEQVPSGALVRLDTRTRQGEILTRPADRDDYLAELGVPAPRAAAVTEHLIAPNHADYPSWRLQQRLQGVNGVADDSSGAHPAASSVEQESENNYRQFADGATSPTVTVLDRFLAARVSREEFEMHLAAGRVCIGGRRVTDPATPAPWPEVIAIGLDPRAQECPDR